MKVHRKIILSFNIIYESQRTVIKYRIIEYKSLYKKYKECKEETIKKYRKLPPFLFPSSFTPYLLTSFKLK